MRARLIVLLVAGAAIAALVVYLLSRGPAQVDPSTLPLAKSDYVGRVYINCSPITDIGYIPNYPCSTYFLVRTARKESATTLLVSEQQALREARWRHVAHASTWGYGPLTDGWIAPNEEACGIITTATAGAHAQHVSEQNIVEPSGLNAFVSAARVTRAAAALYVLLQPGRINGRPRC